MKKLLFICLLLGYTSMLNAQEPADTVKKAEVKTNADDPANFLTRIEVFNELQHYKNDIYLNQTVFRTIIKVGKRFTTRLDLPSVYNSLETPDGKRQSGIGDISFRLLGFKLRERPLSAFTASIEVQLNTAQSPLLGTGKNLLIPVFSYTRIVPRQKLMMSMVFQQANSISGDEARTTVSFTKLQFLLLKPWSPKAWTVLAPEMFIDYVKGGISMNLRSRMTFAPISRINLWVSPSVGLFGDFPGRYLWSADIGGRYFLIRGIPSTGKQTTKN